MKYGFVTGLPRSGSAWLANYLSYGHSMFIHDAWKSCTPEAFKTRVELEKDIKAAGVVDCGNALIFEQINKVFPAAKWVVITRSAEDVRKSCETINFPFVDFTQQLKTIIIKKDPLKVPFVEMFDRADEIGRFLFEDWDCPAWRKSQLKSLNVQLHWGRVSDQFRVPEILKKVDTLTPTKMEYLRLVKEIVKDDPHAVRFLVTARDASELYRQLKEGRAVDVDKALGVLESMATEWLISPFVKNFSNALAPALMSCLEKYQNEKHLEHCPVDVDLLTVVTYIYQGNEGVKQYMPKVRELSDKILKEKVN